MTLRSAEVAFEKAEAALEPGDFLTASRVVEIDVQRRTAPSFDAANKSIIKS
jgi:hypothetical protein